MDRDNSGGIDCGNGGAACVGKEMRSKKEACNLGSKARFKKRDYENCCILLQTLENWYKDGASVCAACIIFF